MSYILDALRKADAERARGAVPGLHAAQGPDVDSPSDRTRVRLLGWAVGVLVVALLGSLAWQMGTRHDDDTLAFNDGAGSAQPAANVPPSNAPSPSLPAPAVREAPPVALPATPPVVPAQSAGPSAAPQDTHVAAAMPDANRPALPPMQPAEPNAGAMRAPPPLLEQPREIRPPAREPRHEAPPQEAARRKPTPSHAAAPSPPTDRTHGTQPRDSTMAAAGMAAAPRTPAETAPGTRASTSATSTSTSRTAPTEPARRNATPANNGAPSPASTAPSGTGNSHVYAINELPDGVRASLPKYAVSGSSYSENPAARLLIVNGQVAREGDMLPGGAAVEQIKLKGAVLKYKGYRYELTY